MKHTNTKLNNSEVNSGSAPCMFVFPSPWALFLYQGFLVNGNICCVPFLNESFGCSEKGPCAIEGKAQKYTHRSLKPVSPGPGHSHCLKYISQYFACPSFKCHAHQLGFMPMSPVTQLQLRGETSGLGTKGVAIAIPPLNHSSHT